MISFHFLVCRKKEHIQRRIPNIVLPNPGHSAGEEPSSAECEMDGEGPMEKG